MNKMEFFPLLVACARVGAGVLGTRPGVGGEGVEPSQDKNPSPPTLLPQGERGERAARVGCLSPEERGPLLPSPLGGKGLGVRGWNLPRIRTPHPQPLSPEYRSEG